MSYETLLTYFVPDLNIEAKKIDHKVIIGKIS